MTPDRIDELADRIFDAISAGDTAAVDAMWADDIEVWHNTDGIVQTKEQNLAVVAWMIGNTATIEYRDVVRHVVDDGFAQRHVLRVSFDDGRIADLPAAIFVRVSDEKISRIDEYLDSAQIAAAFPGADFVVDRGFHSVVERAPEEKEPGRGGAAT